MRFQSCDQILCICQEKMSNIQPSAVGCVSSFEIGNNHHHLHKHGGCFSTGGSFPAEFALFEASPWQSGPFHLLAFGSCSGRCSAGLQVWFCASLQIPVGLFCAFYFRWLSHQFSHKFTTESNDLDARDLISNSSSFCPHFSLPKSRDFNTPISFPPGSHPSS